MNDRHTSPEERDEQEDVIAATLALTEHYFGYADPHGRRCVPLDQAGVLATGRLGDLMAGWEDLSAEEHERLGRLWQVRGDDLARETDFANAARYYAACDRGLYTRPENEEPEHRRYLVALHAEAPSPWLTDTCTRLPG